MTLPEQPKTETSETLKKEQTAAAALLRIAQLSNLFSEIHDTIEVLRAEARRDNMADWVKIISKLSEMQTLHVKLLTAEESFHDKFNQHADMDTIDYDRIRHDIGRALDRIRAASRTDDVSERPDAG